LTELSREDARFKKKVMKLETTSRSEVMVAGIGGMGVLVAGQVLAWAAVQRYKYVSYIPSYEAARRGGLSECTVIFSDEEIASPILEQVQTVIILDGAQLKAFESRVRPGGIIIVDCAGLVDKPERKDFKLLSFSGMEIAIGMGESLINNLILLGVYVELTKTVPEKFIEEELHRRYGDKGKILDRNIKAFQRGLELAKTTA